jgi:hypothetical protein
MLPKGQAATQVRHWMQRDRTMPIAPVSLFLTNASVGQTATHAASAH